MSRLNLRGNISNTRKDVLWLNITHLHFATVCLSQYDSHPHIQSTKGHCTFRAKQYNDGIDKHGSLSCSGLNLVFFQNSWIEMIFSATSKWLAFSMVSILLHVFDSLNGPSLCWFHFQLQHPGARGSTGCFPTCQPQTPQGSGMPRPQGHGAACDDLSRSVQSEVPSST